MAICRGRGESALCRMSTVVCLCLWRLAAGQEASSIANTEVEPATADQRTGDDVLWFSVRRHGVVSPAAALPSAAGVSVGVVISLGLQEQGGH